MPADTALVREAGAAPLALEMVGIRKRFPGVIALDDVTP